MRMENPAVASAELPLTFPLRSTLTQPLPITFVLFTIFFIYCLLFSILLTNDRRQVSCEMFILIYECT